MGVVEQKKEIKRQKDSLERLKKEAEVERVRAQAEARKRVLLEFERGQIGLGLGGAKPSSTSRSAKDNNEDIEEHNKEAKIDECQRSHPSTSAPGD